MQASRVRQQRRAQQLKRWQSATEPSLLRGQLRNEVPATRLPGFRPDLASRRAAVHLLQPAGLLFSLCRMVDSPPTYQKKKGLASHMFI
jgi:hypothetical protein